MTKKYRARAVVQVYSISVFITATASTTTIALREWFYIPFIIHLGLACLSMVSKVTSHVGVGVSKHSVDELVREKSHPRGR